MSPQTPQGPQIKSSKEFYEKKFWEVQENTGENRVEKLAEMNPNETERYGNEKIDYVVNHY